MRRSAQLFAVVLGVSAAACASILGIEDGILDNDGGDGGVVICTADSGVQVDSTQVFVAVDLGDDSAGCTMQTPCKTIAAGIQALGTVPGAHIIYVSSSRTTNYNETLHLTPGTEIQGGWFARGKNPSVQWLPVCPSSDETQFPNIVGTENITVHAENLINSNVLTDLVIKTKPPDPGQSVYGIFASGTTNLTLNHVLIDIGNGGTGTNGANGTDGNLGGGTCTVTGDGTPGSPGDAGVAAPATVFNATGAVSANGTAGGDGAFGSNGTAGPDGGCVSCLNCSTGSCGNPDGTSCGSGGLAGCAGSGGGGGGAGQSGGSSIAVFAWGGAVIVKGGVIHSGSGGNGGAGGAGGKGGIPSDGTAGAQGQSCDTACQNVLGLCSSNGTGKGSVGGAGTPGGAGGMGGPGASGAGGDSVAILSGLDASVLTDAGEPVDLAAGAAGDPGGISAARYP